MQCEFMVTSEGPSRFESNKMKITTKFTGVIYIYIVVHLENACDNYLKE